MRCPGCGRTVDWCNCAEHAEELELFQAQERAYWCDDEPTGVYVRTVTERQAAEDEEQRNDIARYGWEDR